MMNLISMTMENYVHHKNSYIDFSRSGSYYIYAENKDSPSMNRNGSGKSLILDAISWCLFGKQIRGGSLDKIIGQSNKYTKVIQIWHDDASKKYYKIERYRKHPKFKNRVLVFESLNGEFWGEDLGKETKTDTESFIENLFKMNYELFIAGVVLTKPRPELNFAQSKDSVRKQVLTNLLNLSWIDEAREKIKKDLNQIDNEINVSNIVLKEKKNNIDDIRENIKERKIDSKNNELEILKKIKGFKNKLNDLALKSEKNRMNNVKNLRNKYLENKKMLDLKNKFQDMCCKYEDRINSNHKKFEKFEVMLYEVENKKYRYIRLQKDSKELLRKNHCPTCYQKINKEIILNKIIIPKKIIDQEKKLKKKKEFYLEKVRKYENLFKKYEKKYDSLNIHESVVGQTYKEYFEAKNSKMVTEEELRLQGKIEELKKKENPLKNVIHDLEMKLNEHMQEFSNLKSEIVLMKLHRKKLKYAYEAYGPSGLKNDIISGKINLLEKYINQYLKDLTDGDIFVQLDNQVAYGKSEKIGIFIQDSKKVEPLDYELWSGGEKTRIRFAIEYAINSIMESKVDIILIDEGFDDLDTAGVPRMMDFMKKQKHRKMICVSNRPDMENIFINPIKVTMEHGISHVSQPNRFKKNG